MLPNHWWHNAKPSLVHLLLKSLHAAEAVALAFLLYHVGFDDLQGSYQNNDGDWRLPSHRYSSSTGIRHDPL